MNSTKKRIKFDSVNRIAGLPVGTSASRAGKELKADAKGTAMG